MPKGDVYPSYRYNRTEAPVIALDAAHDLELGDDWHELPSECEESAEEPEVPEQEAPADEAPAEKKSPKTKGKTR